MKTLQVVRVELEKRRKQVETSLAETTQKYEESERERILLSEKLVKVQSELDLFRTSSIENESRAAQGEKNSAALKAMLSEAKESVQEEIKQKVNLQIKLRSVEEENNSLKVN